MTTKCPACHGAGVVKIRVGDGGISCEPAGQIVTESPEPVMDVPIHVSKEHP